MRAALAIVVVTLIVIADVSYESSERVRNTSKQRQTEAIEDWEFATYLAVAVALGGVAWLTAAAVPGSRRIRRLTWPVAKYGAATALIGGAGFAALSAASAVIARARPIEFFEHRYELECTWLFGAVLGGLFGSAVGAGLGAAAYRSRRTVLTEEKDPEREHYRDGPDGAVGSSNKSGSTSGP